MPSRLASVRVTATDVPRQTISARLMKTKFEAIRRGAASRRGGASGVRERAVRRAAGLVEVDVVAMRGRTSLWIGRSAAPHDQPTLSPRHDRGTFRPWRRYRTRPRLNSTGGSVRS